MKQNVDATTMMRKLGTLKPHPQQDVLFPPLSDVELQALADDMQQNGLKHPVEILPNDVIVCGHQRVAAAKLLGWKEINCCVRHDLAAAGDDAVEERLIADNLNRRQLSELDVARLVRRLRSQRTGKRTVNGHGQWRDEIAKRFGVSGRTLTRWEQVLDADERVQTALSRKGIKLSQAIAIASLPMREQRRIGAGLASGRRLSELLPKADSQSPPTAKQPTEPLTAFALRLDRLTKELEAVTPPVTVSAADRQTLDNVRSLLRHLLERLGNGDRNAALGSGDWLPLRASKSKRRSGRKPPSRHRTQDVLS